MSSATVATAFEPVKAQDERYLEVTGVTKRFGATVVLEALDLAVGRSEFVSLLGPSGCGKTTLLRLIAGLLRPDAGRLQVGGNDITRLAAHKRNIGVVFQNYALFPHFTVEQNVAFGLLAQRRPKAEVVAQVDHALDLVRMKAFADRRISALSGGQQQRVAVARAIIVKPTLLLLDEPFSALDRKLRETMQIELRHLLRDLGITSIFVTHDQDEALVMSDRIAVMNEGRIEQLGTPGEIYRSPSSLHVMEFVGQSTRLAGSVDSVSGGVAEIRTPLGTIRAPVGKKGLRAGDAVVVGVRPESMTLGERPGAELNHVRAALADIVFFGAKTALHFKAPGVDDRIQSEVARLPPGLSPGSEVDLRWPINETMVYPAP
jgi:putative spermidine/putrescine transport system ATP-binding protein